MSFGGWDDVDSVRAWKGSAEFRTRMASVQEHVAEFKPSELEIVRSTEAGVATGS
jgi:heme-degrading monooxygenase HmoA